MAEFSQQDTSSAGMTDLINATKGQALNTGALVQSSQNQVTQATALVTSTNNLVTATNNLVTQTTNLVTAFNNLSTSINNALSMGAWNTWSPTVSSGSGTITTVGAIVARYQASGKTTYFSTSVTITTNGSAAGWVNITLPSTAKAATVFVGRESQNSFKELQGIVAAGSNLCSIQFYDSTYPGSSGAVIVLSGVYEAQ